MPAGEKPLLYLAGPRILHCAITGAPCYAAP